MTTKREPGQSRCAYRPLGIERGIPEIFNSTYDIRNLLVAVTRLRDGERPAMSGHVLPRRWLTEN